MMADVRNALTTHGAEDRQQLPREGGGVRHHCPLCGQPAAIARCPVCARPFYRTSDRRQFCSRSCSGRGVIRGAAKQSDRLRLKKQLQRMLG